MVGLPARGKTYIAKKMTRYFNWIGINTRGKCIYMYILCCTVSVHICTTAANNGSRLQQALLAIRYGIERTRKGMGEVLLDYLILQCSSQRLTGLCKCAIEVY